MAIVYNRYMGAGGQGVPLFLFHQRKEVLSLQTLTSKLVASRSEPQGLH